ncbi:hypothetical protein AMATHDRAFT_45966 [Amanita thiersii Skay4041]|uniref:Uncharacterized protein n=1 Tax=Amanita thiersii Skay4041 TaxID=703135 RepID=A0A2A9NQC3_9AGAR|nr:hypothetical protein AMATHDRAFT_45966 [Amanita thiersii Skay4041]
MSFMDHHDLSPPPAYSEQDFDRKVSTAIELSLHTPQPTNPTQDELWEDWNEEAFQVAARALGASNHYPHDEKHPPTHYPPGASSSSSVSWTSHHPAQSSSATYQSVEPLNIVKKAPTSNDPSKSRHQMLHAAGVNIASTSFPVIEEDHPPPPFSPGGGVNGPSPEQFANPPWFGAGSAGSSPLASPTKFNSQPHQPRMQDLWTDASHQQARQVPQHVSVPPQRRLPRQSLPPIPHVQQHSPANRPLSDYTMPHKAMPTPDLAFDPSIAYNQDSITHRPRFPSKEQVVQENTFSAGSLYK